MVDSRFELLNSLQSTRKIAGLTHNYYRYPARFSPEFVRESILHFSKPGDYILDAFMGSGTTIVEAIANGRNAIGFDISPLANFITSVKTTPLSNRDKYLIIKWLNDLELNQSFAKETFVKELKNVPEHLNKLLIYISRTINTFELPRQRNFAKCVLLRWGQWILDCRKELPNIDNMHMELMKQGKQMLLGLDEFVTFAQNNGVPKNKITSHRKLYTASVDELSDSRVLNKNNSKIKLILTSPPYPGVHVLYHRWQVNSRRETAAPFWIAGLNDGHGEAHYTMGGRSKRGNEEYFHSLCSIFQSLRRFLGENAIVIQLVSFANPDEQLAAFLNSMELAGYDEIFPLSVSGGTRVSRQVPNRKWYTMLDNRENQHASVETLLFHTPRPL